MREIVEEEIEQIPSILGDGLLIPNGTMVRYGPPQSKKSFAIQQLMYCIAEGIPWLGIPVHSKHNTLYVELEIAAHPFQNRTRKISDYYGSVAKGAFYAHPYTLIFDDDTAIAELIQHINDHNIEVLFLDPLNLVMAGSENDDVAVKYFVRLLNAIRELADTKPAVGFVHHQSKGKWHAGEYVNRGKVDVSGGKQLASWPDTICRLAPARKDSTKTILSWEKTRNAGTQGEVWLEFDEEKLVLVKAGDSPEAAVESLLSMGPISVTEWDKQLTAFMGLHKARLLRKELVASGSAVYKQDPNDPKRKVIMKKEDA